MDEEDELVGGDDVDSAADYDEGPPAPPDERDDDEPENGAEGEDGGSEAMEDEDEAEEMAGAVSQLPDGVDEDDDDPELDSINSVPYNRQFYGVPNSAIARDYNHPLEVASIERLSEMAASTPPPEKWPSPDQIEPSMIVVLRGKVATGDTQERFVWYIRITVAGDDGADGDDKNIFRHIPKPVVKKLVAHYNADSTLRTSSLLTKYVPFDDNNKPLNPSKLHENNWNVRKPPPKTLAQTIGKENKDGAARVGSSSSSSGKRPMQEDAPLAEPVLKKAKQGTIAPPLSKAQSKAPAPAPKPSLKDLGKGPTKSSSSSSGIPSAKPKAAAPAPAASAPAASKPKAAAPAPTPAKAKEAKEAKAPAPAPAASKAASARGSPSAVPAPPTAAAVRDHVAATSGTQVVPMGGAPDLGPAPGHKMVKTITVSNDSHNPEEMCYTVTFPNWAKSWKITAEFTGEA